MFNFIKCKNKKIIILFLDASTGELFVGLPIIWLSKKMIDCEIYFVSTKKNILKDMNVSQRYIDIMQKHGGCYFGKFKSASLLLKLMTFQNSVVQISCYSGMRRIERIYYSILKKSTMLFFPHAYSPFPIDGINNFKSEKESEEKFSARYGMNSSILISGNREKFFFENDGWKSDSIHSIGALGYRKEWLNYFFNNDNFLERDNRGEFLTIFVPLRDVHNIYLSEENYNYQVASLVKIFKVFFMHRFIIKLHPRQKKRELEKIFEECDNVYFSKKSPFEIAIKSDLTLGFWTSALTDSVAVGTPSIEFHRHKVAHNLLLRENGKLTSLYAYLGFSESFDNVDDIIGFIASLNSDKLKLLHNNQYEKLRSNFMIGDEFPKLNLIMNDIFNKSKNPSKKIIIEKGNLLLKLIKKLIKKIIARLYWH
jgi:hypothetical protein